MSEQRIAAVGVSSGEPAPVVPNLPILSSATTAWDGILVEQHRLRALQIPEHSLPKHLICIHLSSGIELDWRVAGERLQSRLTMPDDISLTPQAYRGWCAGIRKQRFCSYRLSRN
jgi:hypothetical protein